MKRFTIAAVIGALVTGILLKGTFGHTFIVLIGMILWTPFALFMVLWLVIGLKRTGEISTGLTTTFFVSMIVGGSLLLSLGIGKVVHYWEIHEVRSYVARMVPILDEYRVKHEEYPQMLAALEAPSPPKLMMEPSSYSADSDHFRFEYWDPAGMMDGYFFDSSTREWTYFD